MEKNLAKAYDKYFDTLTAKGSISKRETQALIIYTYLSEILSNIPNEMELTKKDLMSLYIAKDCLEENFCLFNNLDICASSCSCE